MRSATRQRAATTPAGKLDLDADDELVQRREPRQVPRHLLPAGARRTRRSSATSRRAGIRGVRRTPRATSASSSRAAACSCGRFTANGSTASATTITRRRRNRAAGSCSTRAKKSMCRRTRRSSTSTTPAHGCRRGTAGRPITDEDRRTIARWIDLGCPIDLDYDPQKPPRHARLRLDARRPAADADAHLPGARQERGTLAHRDRDARLWHRVARGQLPRDRRFRHRRRRGGREPRGRSSSRRLRVCGSGSCRSRSRHCRPAR